MTIASTLGLFGDLNSPGRYLHWSIFTVSEANLVLIAVMVVIFGAALVIPFPGHGRQAGPPSATDMDEGDGSNGPADVELPVAGMVPTPPCGRRGCGERSCVTCRRASCSPTASPPTSPPGSTSSAWPPWRPSAVVDRLGLRHRPRGHRLVAHQPCRTFLQQPSPLECRSLHGVYGHPPVGQVLDGCMAGQAGAHLGHGGGRLHGVGRRMLHRLPVPAELRLPVDLHQRQGRL